MHIWLYDTILKVISQCVKRIYTIDIVFRVTKDEYFALYCLFTFKFYCLTKNTRLYLSCSNKY